MEQDITPTTTSSDKCFVVHMKIIGGTQADVYELGKAMKEFKTHLPFRLEALVTNDRVVLEDVASWIRELLKLRKQLQAEGEFKDEMPRM